MLIVLMGVTGSGKTTIGKAVERESGAIFADADDYHSEANKAKMSAGHPLTDADRQPWLESLNRLMLGWLEDGKSGVLACSALKGKYRATLRADMPEGALDFVLLDVPQEALRKRLAARKGSFMNPDLLESQIETLERSGDTVTVCNDKDPKDVAREILNKVGWKG